jgi:hypothetical protein
MFEGAFSELRHSQPTGHGAQVHFEILAYRDMAMNRIFRGFCINRFGLCPLHYISSRSVFGFEFVEIFAFEKRFPVSVSQGVGKIAYRYNYFQTFK